MQPVGGHKSRTHEGACLIYEWTTVTSFRHSSPEHLHHLAVEDSSLWLEFPSASVVLLLHCCLYSTSVEGQPAPAPSSTNESLFPAFFIFGDSLVDCGNNDYILLSLAKANLLPNGIDFPSGAATGRFCNGKTSFDILCDRIGLPYPPASLAPTSRGPAILGGLNYASGAAGILDGSGANYIERLTFNDQIALYQQTVRQLTTLIGRAAATNLTYNSLFGFAIGSNDYINNYLLSSNNSTRAQYTRSQFVDLLMSNLTSQFTTLYNWGARKFLVSNLGPMGCIPNRLALGSLDGSCVASDNELVKDFNKALRNLTKSLPASLPDSIFLYGNSYDIVYDIIQDPFPKGFNVVTEGCCGAGAYNAQLPCLPVIDTLCSNRSEYAFWDAFHPTAAINEILGNRSFGGPSSDVYPINVRQLSRLQI